MPLLYVWYHFYFFDVYVHIYFKEKLSMNQSDRAQLEKIEDKYRELQFEVMDLKSKHEAREIWNSYFKSALQTFTILFSVFTLLLAFVGVRGYFEIEALKNRLNDELKNAQNFSKSSKDTINKIITISRDDYCRLRKITLASQDTIIRLSKFAQALRDSIKKVNILMNDLNTNVIDFASIFQRIPLDYPFISMQNKALLFLISFDLYSKTKLFPASKEGLPAYNLALTLSEIGEYERAIRFFEVSKTLQTQLKPNQQENLLKKINQCKEHLKEQELIRAVSLNDSILVDPDKISINVLLRYSEIFPQSIMDEFMRLGYLNYDQYTQLQKLIKKNVNEAYPHFIRSK